MARNTYSEPQRPADSAPAGSPRSVGGPHSAVRLFSTRGLGAGQRIELWEEHNARALVGLNARTLNGDPLEATELNLQLPRLQFAHVTANPHVVERDSRQIALNPGDGVALYFTVSGESFFYAADGVHVQRPGGLLACDISTPFLRGFAHGLQEFVITIPSALFADISGDGRLVHPLTMSFARAADSNAQATALARLLRSTFFASDLDELRDVEIRAIGLLRSIFSADDRRRSSDHRTAAMAYIERHFRDPTLSVSRVAAGIGISERQLGRVFSETGQGVARVILQRRLEVAHRILSGAGAPSVGAVAVQCGFSSHAHFTRVFRERYEVAPALLRAASARHLTIPATD